MLDKISTLSDGIDCIVRQNAWSLNESNLSLFHLKISAAGTQHISE